jgi:lipopolysaccharide export system permease protein
MRLWRYILRAHAGPFIASNAIIIFLFLLQFLMKSAGELVGKGLGIWVILELIALNLAWMLVLSVPMSVLISTLMAFGKLSSQNEIVIMRASGMSLYRMIAPVMVCAGLVTYGLIVFNNDVLPEANIRLRTLMSDIFRIKPTLTLQPGVFTTDEELPNYRILARKTFEHSNDLEGVTIYDLSRPDVSVVLTARRGKVSFSPDYSRILMDMDNGEIHELKMDKLQSYRRIRFVRHRVSIPASGFGFQRSNAATAQRDDRTMSAAMMRVIVDSIRGMQRRKMEELDGRMRQYVGDYLAGRPTLYATSPAMLRSRVLSERAGNMVVPVRRPARDTSAAVARNAVATAQDSAEAWMRALTDARQMQSRVQNDIASIAFDDRQMDKYLVEIYKKYSIPFACLVFILIGAPLGMMSRRGGFGMGAGLSLGFFLFYWICLISGEKLADRDVLSPFVGMWVANLILGICGAVLTARSARESTVIDWSRFSRFIPRAWRSDTAQTTVNPHEA